MKSKTPPPTPLHPLPTLPVKPENYNGNWSPKKIDFKKKQIKNIQGVWQINWELY